LRGVCRIVSMYLVVDLKKVYPDEQRKEVEVRLAQDAAILKSVSDVHLSMRWWTMSAYILFGQGDPLQVHCLGRSIVLNVLCSGALVMPKHRLVIESVRHSCY
jgi:hypothetical protein